MVMGWLERSSRDLLACFLLLLLGVLLTRAYFHSWPKDYFWPTPACPSSFATILYGPSIGFASGHGLRDIQLYWNEPSVAAFLQQKSPVLDPIVFESGPGLIPMSQFQQEHQYLLLTVGLLWRIFGISWLVLKYFLFFMVGVSGVLAYFLFRLGSNRVLSFAAAAAFVCSPLILAVSPDPRDFSKVPLFLTAFLLMGKLVLAECPPRRRLLYVVLLAMAAGFGVGFRREMFLVAPPTIGMLAAGLHMTQVIPWRRRLIELGVFCICVVPPAIPVLTIANGTPAAFHFLNGIATSSEVNLGLSKPPYERLYLCNDNFVHDSYSSYLQRVHGATEQPMLGGDEANAAAREFAWEMVRTFPADFLLRWYSIVQHVFSDLGLEFARHFNMDRQPQFHLWSPLSTVLRYVGLPCLLLVLAGLAMRRPSVAWFALGAVLYFCGCCCITYQLRHLAHLLVLPLFTLTVLLQQLEPSRLREWMRQLGLPSNRYRALPIMLVVLAGLPLPLFALRALQTRTVGELYEAHAAANLVPTETKALTLAAAEFQNQGVNQYGPTSLREPWYSPAPTGDWYGLQPTQLKDIAPGDGNEFKLVRHSYAVVQLGPFQERLPLWIRYAQGDGRQGFWALCWVEPPPDGGQQNTRYFFPVYEATGLQFKGVAVPVERKDILKGLAHVEDLTQFPLLLNLALPEDWQALPRYQRLWKWGLEPAL